MKVNWPERVWINSPVRRLVQAREVRRMRALRGMPAGGHVLEIGCGNGAGARLVARTFAPRRVDALDIDMDLLRMARRIGPTPGTELLFMAGDAQRLPYEDGCLDAVFNFGIIHHLEDWRAGLREIARVLKPGGGFYFEEIYPPLYANFLFRRILAHPREDRFHGPEYRAGMAAAGLSLLPGYSESRFGILGAAVKDAGTARAAANA